ncbi:MAG: response regulator [Acidobacteria bacterium]|nr:response regulator [Acidobacteriota bacterium]
MRVVKLLLVDDEARFVETLSKRLTARGFEVEGALGGPQALELLRTRPVDVVLLDVWMPGMDGLEVLKEIRRLHPSVRVVLVSGNASITAAVEGIRLGASDYLLKPVDIEDVLVKVEEAFEKKTIEEADGAS